MKGVNLDKIINKCEFFQFLQRRARAFFLFAIRPFKKGWLSRYLKPKQKRTCHSMAFLNFRFQPSVCMSASSTPIFAVSAFPSPYLRYLRNSRCFSFALFPMRYFLGFCPIALCCFQSGHSLSARKRGKMLEGISLNFVTFIYEPNYFKPRNNWDKHFVGWFRFCRDI